MGAIILAGLMYGLYVRCWASEEVRAQIEALNAD